MLAAKGRVELDENKHPEGIKISDAGRSHARLATLHRNGNDTISCEQEKFPQQAKKIILAADGRLAYLFVEGYAFVCRSLRPLLVEAAPLCLWRRYLFVCRSALFACKSAFVAYGDTAQRARSALAAQSSHRHHIDARILKRVPTVRAEKTSTLRAWRDEPSLGA
jgi:hypothetical protein